MRRQSVAQFERSKKNIEMTFQNNPTLEERIKHFEERLKSSPNDQRVKEHLTRLKSQFVKKLVDSGFCSCGNQFCCGCDLAGNEIPHE